MRQHCAQCTIKHLSTALVLESYSRGPYDECAFDIVGNLLEAADEIIETSETLAMNLHVLAYMRYMAGGPCEVPYEEYLDVAEHIANNSSYEMVLPQPFMEERLVALRYNNEYLTWAHLAQASVLADEVWGGYMHYWTLVVGHLNAAAMYAGRNKNHYLEGIIREHRIKYTEDHAYCVPFYDLAMYCKHPNTQWLDKIKKGLELDKDGNVVLSGDTRSYFNDKTEKIDKIEEQEK